MKTHLNNSNERKHYLVNKSSLPNTKFQTVYIGTYSTTNTTKQPAHKHSFCEVMLITNGEGTIIINDRSYQIRKGNLVVYSPKFPHYEMAKKDNNLQSIFFAMKYNQSLIPALSKKDFYPIIDVTEQYDDFLAMFTFMAKESANASELYLNEILNNTCQMIFLKILSLSSIQITSDRLNASFSTLKEYIDNHYLEDFLLKDVCEKFYINKYYISQLFKENLGITPISYVIEKRMEEAKRLLQTTNLPISTISDKVGYEDTYHFSRLFKKEVGVSPKTFRNNANQ